MSFYPRKLKPGGTELDATAAELDVLDGVTAGTATASKAVVLDANSKIDALDITALTLNGTAVDSTAAELNILDGVTADASELNLLDGVTSTTAELNILDGVTADKDELNILDGVPTDSYTDGVGAVSGTGVTVEERGFGYHKTTVLTLTDVDVALTDEAGVVAYGGLKIYDFPAGYIYTQSALTDLAITKSSAGVDDTWNGDIGLGTVTADNDASLASTEQDIIPSTATPAATAGATTGDAVSTASEHAILDGTGTAKELYVNLLVDEADHDVGSTACNLILNGTIVVNWIFMGDN